MFEILEGEEFRPIPISDGGEASNKGRVRRRSEAGWQLCRQWKNNKGYFSTRVPVGGKLCRFLVHRLVLMAFHGMPEPGQVGRHMGSNDPTDNRPENLAWGTRKENSADRKRHGTHFVGSRCPHAKLTEDDVAEMRRLRVLGWRRDDIAERFGVAPTHVSKVLLGKMWGHTGLTPERAAELKHAGYVRGESHHLAKLDDGQVAEIRRLRAEGVKTADLSQRFGVHFSTICRIVNDTTRKSAAKIRPAPPPAA